MTYECGDLSFHLSDVSVDFLADVCCPLFPHGLRPSVIPIQILFDTVKRVLGSSGF